MTEIQDTTDSTQNVPQEQGAEQTPEQNLESQALPPGVTPELDMSHVGGEASSSPKPDPQASPQPTYNPVWDVVKTKMGEEYQLPEEITKGELTPEKELDMLADIILSNSDATPNFESLPQSVQEYLYFSQDPNFDEVAFFKHKASQQDIANVDSETFMKNFLAANYLKSEQNPQGTMNEQQVHDTIEKMKQNGQLDIAAAEYKQMLLRNQQEARAREAQMREQQIEQNRELAKQNIQRDLSLLRKQYEDIDEIAGMRIGKSEISKALDDFTKAVTPDQQTGIAPIQNLMQSNNFLFESFLLTVYRNGDLLKELLTNTKEMTKDRIFEKLRVRPQTGGGSVMPLSTGVDPSKLV